MSQNTYSRADLQQLAAKYRKEKINDLIHNLAMNGIIRSAREGKKEYFWIISVDRSPFISFQGGVNDYLTNEELLEVLKEKFPDTTVEYQETWIETRPGLKEKKKGFLIDWS
jgi:hypothetical protein